MKIPYNSHHAPSDSDLHAKAKPKTPATTRLKRFGPPSGKQSRPETPLLKWKINDQDDTNSSSVTRSVRRTCWNSKKKQSEVAVSARSLAAGLWRLHMPEMEMNAYRRSEDRLSLQEKLGFGFFCSS